MKKKLGLLLAVAMVMMVAITGCGKEEKLNMGDCMTLDSCGFNGDGHVTEKIDDDALYSQILNLAGDDAKIDLSNQEYVVYELASGIRSDIHDAVRYGNVGFSNGDEVEIDWEISEETAQMFEALTGISVERTGTLEGVVSGLE